MRDMFVITRLAAGLLLALCLLAPLAAAGDPHVPTAGADPLLRLDDAALREWVGDYERASPAPAAVLPATRTRSTTGPVSFSLLSLVPYVAAERDQGAAGTCWVWAGTGCLELANLFSAGIHDRLSVQWFDSNFQGGAGPNWAGNGGTLTDFADFYDQRRIAVPWANTNASYVDGDVLSVIEERALMPASLISEEPHHTLVSVSEQRVVTRGVGQDQAIANIKAQVDRGRPVFVGLSFPNQAAVSSFLSLWYGGGESAVWDPTPFDGAAWDPSHGAAHAVLCVGYDVSDPDNPYWIMLNSMGTAGGSRPAGTFRMAMDLDYDASYPHDYPLYPAQWEVLEAAFTLPTPTPTPTPGVVPFPGQSLVPTDPDHDGLYEDVNGNGRADFADVVLLFNELDWWAVHEPIAAFDFNANSRADFADVVRLFERL